MDTEISLDTIAKQTLLLLAMGKGLASGKVTFCVMDKDFLLPLVLFAKDILMPQLGKFAGIPVKALSTEDDVPEGMVGFCGYSYGDRSIFITKHKVSGGERLEISTWITTPVLAKAA